MTLYIGKEAYFNVESFYTEYQPNNGRSHWIFIKEINRPEYAVEYNPKKEQIEVL